MMLIAQGTMCQGTMCQGTTRQGTTRQRAAVPSRLSRTAGK